MRKSSDVDGRLQITRDGAVAIIELSAPPLNLLTQKIRSELRSHVTELAVDPAVRAIVIHGGTNFCAGADLKEFSQRSDPAVAEAHCRNGHSMALALVELDKPLIAAVEGACLGGGFEIALCCQRRVVASKSRIGLPEINRGIFPGTGGIRLLERLVGAARAHQWLISGQTFDIEAREAVGIADAVVASGTALDHALSIAADLAAQPTLSVAATARLLLGDFRTSFRAYLDSELREYVAIYQTQDAAEGWRSFLEKRSPNWTHR